MIQRVWQNWKQYGMRETKCQARKRAVSTGSLLMMTDTMALPGSMGQPKRLIASHRMPISIAAVTACARMNGRQKYTGRAETVRNVPRFDDGSVRPSQFNWALGSSHTCPKGQSPKTFEENERLEHWCQVKKTMIAAQVARIIANFAIFCELSDDDVVDPDEACGVMEVLGSQLEAMDKPFLRKLVDAFSIIAVEYSGKAQELVRDLPYGFYLEEALALDDPARLAELGAIRDARP